MSGMHYLACLWTLVLLTGCVCSEIQFFERHEGDSVLLPCMVEQRQSPPVGFYLKRSWLRSSDVLFMLTKSDFHMTEDKDKNRTSVSGDPSSRSVNVTISQLRASDTDRYYCEFVEENPSSDYLRLPGKTEFFLLVSPDAPGLVDIGVVQTCAGGSAVLPCLPPNGDGLPVEGVILKRRRGLAPVEVLYHSKLQHGSSPPFSADKVRLSSAPGPGGFTFNLTLLQLQPEDSGLYSCQLLLRGRPDSSTSLGRQVFSLSVQVFQSTLKCQRGECTQRGSGAVSVQFIRGPRVFVYFSSSSEVDPLHGFSLCFFTGGQCGCSSYSTLLYAVSSAVAVLLLLLLLIGFVMIYKGRSRRSVKSRPQAPIYEEMTGVTTASQKLASAHLEEMESSVYRNCTVKKSCPENPYESPSGALYPRRETQK